MSQRPRLALAVAGFPLLVSIVACTLTGDDFHPQSIDALQPAPVTGGTSSEPAPPAGEPSPTCRDGGELGGCPIQLSAGSNCETDLDCDSQVCVSGGCASPTCNDDRQNGGEGGVDCGGPCERACTAGGCSGDADCESRNCRAGDCQPATCDDGIANQGEAATDCAGPCPARCLEGDTCRADADCGPQLFCPEATRHCTSISCQDGILDGNELQADCGGGMCPGCPVGSPCGEGSDCSTGVCGNAGTCSAASCTDAVRNQNETGVDCGGRCPDCRTGQPCGTGADCQSGVCGAAGCATGIDLCCQAPSCNDGVRNGNEPVVDCGNATCGGCPLGNACTANGQCTSGFCQGAVCRPSPCTNGTRDGTETDTDCGGGDPICARCSVGDTCAVNADCASNSCINGQCADCADGRRNGTETGVDCGGACGRCGPGQVCAVDTDCQSNACQDGRCCGGAGVDCTRCARRLVTAINCSSNGAGAQPNCDAFLDCLTSNAAICTRRYALGCSDEPGSVCDNTRFGGTTGPGVGLADAIIGSAGCEF